MWPWQKTAAFYQLLKRDTASLVLCIRNNNYSLHTKNISTKLISYESEFNSILLESVWKYFMAIWKYNYYNVDYQKVLNMVLYESEKSFISVSVFVCWCGEKQFISYLMRKIKRQIKLIWIYKVSGMSVLILWQRM